MGKVILTGYVILPEADFDAISMAIPKHIRLTRNEPGCLKFTFSRDKVDPFRYSLYEEFVDQAAFEYHKERTHASDWHQIAKNMERHFSIIKE